MAKHPRFIIDKITNSIEEIATGTSYQTEVVLVSDTEIKMVHKKDGWFFNWKKEFKIPQHQVSGTGQNFIEMHLIENAPHNFGENKMFAGVAGNLVAFACKRSFDLGFEGFVAFVAKTDLIEHYIETIGAQVIYNHTRMAIFRAHPKISLSNFFDYHAFHPLRWRGQRELHQVIFERGGSCPAKIWDAPLFFRIL